MSKKPMDHATKVLRTEREKLVTTIECWERMIEDERSEVAKCQQGIKDCRQEIEQIDAALKALSARKP